MTVKEVLTIAAQCLGVGEKVEAYLAGNSSVGEKETQALLKCFNVVENEVALDYLPLMAEDVLLTTTGKVAFGDLNRSAVRILSVKNENGDSVKYEVFPEYLIAQPGTLTIRYTYTPETKGIDGESDFKLLVSERLLAYGVAAEYCFSCGAYDEGETWNKKYRDALAAAYRAKPAKVIASRRWE